MRIEITDFPSDPLGETGNLRKECMAALRKADTYPNKADIVESILKFSLKKLNESRKQHKAAALALTQKQGDE